MKKVCFFNTVQFWGGGEKLHLEYALEFRKKGYDVVITARYQSDFWTKATADNFNVNTVRNGNLSFLNIFKLLKLSKQFKRIGIDTVIFSTSQDMKFASLAAKLAGVKRIVYLRGLAVPIKSKLVNRLLLKYVVTHIVANSTATKQAVLKHLQNVIPADAVKVIYHGIEIDDSVLSTQISPLKEIESKCHGVILGNAGRLTAQKGQKLLIVIARILRDQHVDFTLFIAGQGELKNELQALITEHDLEKTVILLDFVSDMERFMQSIDIFVLSSLWEGFGYVLVEAMIKKKPVVAWDISSNPEIVANNKTGFLAETLNEEDFANKLKVLINDEALRKSMGIKGEIWVRENFDLKDRIDEFENYLIESSESFFGKTD